MKYLRFSGIFLFFLAATALITLPFIQVLASTLYNYGDSLLLGTTMGWNAFRLLTDPLRLYEAPLFYPYPNTLAYSDSIVPQSLLALPVILATNNLPFYYNLSVLFAFGLNGFSMYLLIRELKGNTWGALIGGLVFAFGHYHLNHFQHLNLLSTEWMPLVLLFLHRGLARQRKKDWFLLGLFTLLSVLSSFYYAFMTGAIIGVYVLYRLLAVRGRLPRAALYGLGLTMLAALLLTLPFGLPYIQIARDYGQQRTLNEIVALSATPASYLASVSTMAPFSVIAAAFPVANAEAILSPGYVAMLLALWGLVRSWRKPLVLGLVLIGLTGFILSLGPELKVGGSSLGLPYRLLIDYIPGFGGAMRSAGRWGVLVLLTVAVLAGLGTTNLFELLKTRRLAALVLGLAILTGMLVEYNQYPVRMMTGTLINRPTPPVYQWLREQPDGAAIELPMSRPGAGDIFDLFYQYYTLVHHKHLVNGESAFFAPNYAEVVQSMSRFPSAEGLAVLRALGVRYVVLHSANLPNWSDTQSRLASFDQSLFPLASFGGDFVYLVSASLAESHLELSVTTPSAARPRDKVHGYLVVRPGTPNNELLSLRGVVDLRIRFASAAGNIQHEETARVHAPLMTDRAGQVLPFEFETPADTGHYQVLCDVTGTARDGNLAQAIDIEQEIEPSQMAPIQLVDSSTGRRAARAGEDLQVILSWQARTRTAANDSVFIHVLDATGTIRAQFNAEPYAGALPLTSWKPGEVITEKYSVHLPSDLPQGRYTLAVGMFNPSTGQIARVLDENEQLEQAIALDTPVWIGGSWNQKSLVPPKTRVVRYGSFADLMGYDVKTQPAPGQSLPLTLFWKAREGTAEDYTVFIHLVDAQGKTVAQGDEPPFGGDYPTSAWNDGEWIRDRHILNLPPSLSPGEYKIQIGWYKPGTGERLRGREMEGGESDSFTLETVAITR